MRTLRLAGVLAAGVVLGSAATQFLHAETTAYVTTQILRQDLNNLPGEEVMIFTSTWQPGARLPLHMHPDGHEITYVISLRPQRDGEGFQDVGGAHQGSR